MFLGCDLARAIRSMLPAVHGLRSRLGRRSGGRVVPRPFLPPQIGFPLGTCHRPPGVGSNQRLRTDGPQE